jgi:hypothetical protein
MNSELSSENQPERRSLDQCFANKPHMRQRLLEISDMIDTLVDQGCTAHEAEAKAIESIRKLGNGILTEWAEKSESAAVAKARANDPKLRPYRKKTPDLAFNVRGHLRFGAAPAGGPKRSPSEAFLQQRPDPTE